MWPKLKEQLPAIILTAVLISGAAFWLHVQTVKEMAAQQDAVLQPMREQNEALKATAEENRRHGRPKNQTLLFLAVIASTLAREQVKSFAWFVFFPEQHVQ